MRSARFDLLTRCISVLLIALMLISLWPANAFAAETVPEGSVKAVKLDVPVEDGVYYADVNLIHYSQNQASMGNVALRGSSSYLQKQPADAEYRSIVIVKDNKATALVEFMPMGYIGMYGMLSELESVEAEYYSKFSAPLEDYTGYYPAQVLTYHKTMDGQIVYDSFNDPGSESAFDGSQTRPAGYGQEERPINLVDQPYARLMALDVTPETRENVTVPQSAEEYTWEHAAIVHVFVPVMFSISPSSGDQYARMQVNWAGLEKIENPDSILNYRLWEASQIEKGDYTDESYQALQTAIKEVTAEMENVWPSQHLDMDDGGFQAQPVLNLKQSTDEEEAALIKKLDDAEAGLTSPVSRDDLSDLIEEAEALRDTDYTESTYSELLAAIRAAKMAADDQEATQEEIEKAFGDLQKAKESLEECDDATKWSNLWNKANEMDESDYTEDSWATFLSTWNRLKAYETSSKLPMVAVLGVSYYINQMQTALDTLEEKPVLDADPANLEDGKYTLKAYMYKTSDPTVYSMANNAINHNVWLEVNDGEYYLTVQFIGMSMYNQFGYLMDLKYFDEGYTIGSGGTPEGNLLDADVLSTQIDSDGKDVIDGYNDEDNLYPAMVRFKLVEKADGRYVPLQVFVPIMESISEGLGTQTVYMELDWSKLRSDDGSVLPQDPPVLSPALDVTDEDTGIKVHADKGVFESGTEFAAENLISGSTYDQTRTTLTEKNVGEKFILYDVYFKDADGENVTPNGKVTYSIPVPEDYDMDSLALIRINDEEDNIGPMTYITGWTIEDGYLTFTYNAKTAKPVHFTLVEKGSVLEPEPTPEPEPEPEPGDNADRFSLEDGIYSVYGEMIKANRQDYSMSNDAINHNIKLTVKDGEYYLTMDFKGISYLNRFGYLANLYYYEDGYTYGQYGAIEGSKSAAEVLSTQKNADGTDVIDEFNQKGGSSEGILYPDLVTFPLAGSALADEEGYVPLHVFVPVMEDIAAGTGSQDVLLKLDWSTIEAASEDDPAFEPDEPVEQSPAVDCTDEKTGVTIIAEKGVFEEGIQIIVEAIESGADYEKASKALSDIGAKFKLYDISFVDNSGTAASPNGTVNISFPVAEGYDSSKLAVYRINDDGTKVLVKGDLANGKYTIATRTGGLYAVVETGSTITDEENSQQIPKTGDRSDTALWLIIVALAAAGTLEAARRRSSGKGE